MLLGQGGVAERPVWISRNGNAVNGLRHGRRERGDSQAQAEGQSQRQGSDFLLLLRHHAADSALLQSRLHIIGRGQLRRLIALIVHPLLFSVLSDRLHAQAVGQPVFQLPSQE